MSGDVTARVIRVIAETQKLDVESIRPESTFEELKIDSLDGINIVFALENEFDINIPNEEAANVGSVAELAAGIGRLIAARDA